MKQHLASDQSGDEEKLLVEEDLPPYATTRATWIRFCVVFGVLHACGMTSITYASSFLGKRESSGTLCLFFGAYTVSALLGATNVVRRKGALMSMVVGFGSYVLLCLSYAAYELLGAGAAADVLVAVSSLVAGGGGALLWVAQTAQYATASAAYAEVQCMPSSDASSEFATIFATIYVCGRRGLLSFVRPRGVRSPSRSARERGSARDRRPKNERTNERRLLDARAQGAGHFLQVWRRR